MDKSIDYLFLLYVSIILFVTNKSSNHEGHIHVCFILVDYSIRCKIKEHFYLFLLWLYVQGFLDTGCEDDHSSPIVYFERQGHIIMYMWIYFWVLCFVPMISVSLSQHHDYFNTLKSQWDTSFVHSVEAVLAIQTFLFSTRIIFFVSDMYIYMNICSVITIIVNLVI